MNKTTDTDKGIKNILAEMAKLNSARVKVGLQDDGEIHKESQMTVASIAAVNEYGSADGRIPSRPAHANAFDDNQGELKTLLERLIKGVSEGKISADRAAKILGQDYENKVKEAIRSLTSPKNAQMTIDAKGFDNPLIATGQTINSVRYIVEGV